MNTAIIVAAGSGKRFKSDKPKQFVEIHGKPLIVHTLERFQSAVSIQAIILVLPEERIDEFAKITGRFPVEKLFAVVAGGSTRAESVQKGFGAISPTTEVVAVHDGARPLVSPSEIDATVEKAMDMGAACLVASVVDTIKTVRGDEIANTLDREKLRRALTPQAFRVEVLEPLPTSVISSKSSAIRSHLLKVTHGILRSHIWTIWFWLMRFSDHKNCQQLSNA